VTTAGAATPMSADDHGAGELEALLAAIRRCRVCRDHPLKAPLPHEPRPVLQASSRARLVIVGQAPGTKVHASGRPFTDPSGVRLREWLGVDEDAFYDPRRFAILPMGFCFPGYDSAGADLPPRSEEVLTCEMEPPQRKLYDKQRDYYRALLLGLIENDGMNDARMKILEGLLRLRQICNHPRLVDPMFKGTSGKFELLIETLETLQAEGHRALVFSQFVQMLTIVREALDARGMH